MAETTTKQSKLAALGRKIARFFKDVRTELKKVIWPTWKQLTNNTLTVLLVCLIIGAIIWLADWGLTKVLELTIAQPK